MPSHFKKMKMNFDIEAPSSGQKLLSLYDSPLRKIVPCNFGYKFFSGP